MKRINILLTSVGGLLTEPLVSNFYKYSLKENIKIKIFGIDNKDNLDIKNYIDYFEKSPLGSEKKYSSFIEEFCRRNKINIIIPRSDEEAIKIAKLKKNGKLKKIEIFVSRYKDLLIINNKISTYKNLDKTNYKFDNWYVCNNQKSLLCNLKKIFNYTQTCIIKPADSRGSRGVLFVFKNREAEKDILAIKNLSNHQLNTYQIFR